MLARPSIQVASVWWWCPVAAAKCPPLHRSRFTGVTKHRTVHTVRTGPKYRCNRYKEGIIYAVQCGGRPPRFWTRIALDDQSLCLQLTGWQYPDQGWQDPVDSSTHDRLITSNYPVPCLTSSDTALQLRHNSQAHFSATCTRHPPSHSVWYSWPHCGPYKLTYISGRCGRCGRCGA